MKWTNDRSGNVDDRRGAGGGGGMLVGGGLGTLIIAAIIFFLGGVLRQFYLLECQTLEHRQSSVI